MTKKIVIVESPAKAKTIAQYLGRDYQVKASFGHVRDLPSNKLSIDPEKDFEVTYQIIPKAKKNIAQLKKDLDGASELFLATDPDREGEAIAWHLVEALKPKISVHRISFQEITKSAVNEAVANPKKINTNLVNAQQARRILDRLVGYKLSPLLWKKVYRGLSAGRVQSVAVRLIVEREREIQNFKPRTYYTVEATLQSGKNTFTATVVNEKKQTLEFLKEEQAKKIAQKLIGKKILVSEIKNERSQLKPKPPLITSTLQQMSVNSLGFSAKKTMKLAQDLYEGVDINGETKALITYMRTDSFKLSDQAKKQAEDLVVKQYTARYLPATPNLFSKKNKNAQEAHEAIRPTDFKILPSEIKQSLSRDHFRLYELIWKVALASTMAPAEVESQAITFDYNDIKLLSHGRKLEFDGFLKLYPSSEERFVSLPELTQNEQVKVKDCSEISHTTEPPARYSEATLVKDLEKRGIGRPSTYAPIMSTIVDRGYVTKILNRFNPEAVAFVVTDLLTENFPDIVDYNFTAELEEQLDDIAQGDKELIPVLKSFYEPFQKNLADKEKTIEKKELTEKETDQKCPECAKPLVIKLGRYGQFYACTGYPDCSYKAPIENEEKELSPELNKSLDEPCPDCSGKLALKRSRFGSFIGCANYPKCRFTKPITITAQAKCPNCNQDIIRKSTKRKRYFWGCSGYPKCKTAYWDEPVAQKCQKCDNLLLKKKTGLVCSSCEAEY